MESKSISSAQVFPSVKLKEMDTNSAVTPNPEVKTVSEKIEEKVDKAQKEKYSSEFLNKQIEGMNRFLEASYTSLKYNVHEKLDRLYVQVVDKETEEVIREVPPEEFLDMIASMLQHMGLIIDKKI